MAITNPGRILPPDWEHYDKYPLKPRLLAAGAPEVPADAKKLWTCPIKYDQGVQPFCVGYGTALLTSAVEYKYERVWGRQRYDALDAYFWANSNDGWTEPHDGSTTRAGFEYLRQVGAHLTRRTKLKPGEPVKHKIERFLWARTVDELVQYMWTYSPGMIGINWYSSFNSPDSNGWIRITPAAKLKGGHNIVVRGFSMPGEYVVLRNSWGNWGYNGSGDCYLSFSDLGRLLLEEGEAGAVVDVDDI